jgi:hypothetical protein
MGDLTSWFHMTFHGFPHAWGESGDRPHTVWEDLTLTHFRRHLVGEIALGVFPMVYDPTNKHVGPRGWIEEERDGATIRSYPTVRKDLWMCSWGCIDIDATGDTHAGQGTEDEVMDYASSLRTILSVQDIPSWVERTRSGGVHVWVFADTWCSTADMRGCLQAAEEISNVPTDSPFPKSEWLLGPPGNFVRLPYWGARKRHDRQVILDEDGQPLSLEDFLHAANTCRARVADIKAAALLKKVPPVVWAPRSGAADNRMWGVLKELYEKGPPEGVFVPNQGRGRGRHGWLFHFAGTAAGDGHSLSSIVQWLIDVDNNHTRKFTGRADQEHQLRRLAIKACESTRSSRP